MARKLIISIDIDDNDLSNILSEYHSDDWENPENPTDEECILSLRNECISWLSNLNITHHIVYKK